MEMSEAIKEAYAHAPADVTYYDTLEFISVEWVTSIKIVRSNRKLHTPQGVYSPVIFDFTLPELAGGVRGQLSINVKFLPKEAQLAIAEAANSRYPITVKYRQYLGENINPDAELPIPIEIISISQTHKGAVLTGVFPDLHNADFPKDIYTVQSYPGLRI